MSSPIPNFFMIGAPKCGTSAMSTYLATNPEVYFSLPKEPAYWAHDFPKLAGYYGIDSLEKYLALFEAATAQQVAVGEKSTVYLASNTAVPEILKHNPSARLIVMLRHPVQMIQSWHGEMLVDLNEDVRDFEAAWNLQDQRAEGLRIPPSCLAPAFLQYRHWACYADHLDRVTKIVPPEQLKIIIFEEFIAEPRRIYCDVCSYLGVRDDGRQDFPPVRESHVHAWPALSRLIMRPPKWLETAAMAIRRHAKQKPSGLIARAKGFLIRKQKRSRLATDFEQHLQDIFTPDIDRLEQILARPLDIWRRKPAAA